MSNKKQKLEDDHTLAQIQTSLTELRQLVEKQDGLIKDQARQIRQLKDRVLSLEGGPSTPVHPRVGPTPTCVAPLLVRLGRVEARHSLPNIPQETRSTNLWLNFRLAAAELALDIPQPPPASLHLRVEQLERK